MSMSWCTSRTVSPHSDHSAQTANATSLDSGAHHISVWLRIVVLSSTCLANEAHLVLSTTEQQHYQLEPLLPEQAAQLSRFGLVCKLMHHLVVNVVLFTYEGTFKMQYAIDVGGGRRDAELEEEGDGHGEGVMWLCPRVCV